MIDLANVVFWWTGMLVFLLGGLLTFCGVFAFAATVVAEYMAERSDLIKWICRNMEIQTHLGDPEYVEFRRAWKAKVKGFREPWV